MQKTLNIPEIKFIYDEKGVVSSAMAWYGKRWYKCSIDTAERLIAHHGAKIVR